MLLGEQKASSRSTVPSPGSKRRFNWMSVAAMTRNPPMSLGASMVRMRSRWSRYLTPGRRLTP